MSAQGRLTPAPQNQEWLSPARLPVTDVPAGSSAPPMFELRPLTTSEVLDRTFAMYRSNFWLFAGIASFSGALQSIVAAVQLLFQGHMMAQVRQMQQGGPPISPFGGVIPGAIAIFASIFYFLAWSITMAACIFALGEIYLGRRTTITESFGATIRRWYAYLGIACWQVGSLIWLPLLLLIPGVALLAVGATRSTALSVVGGVLLFLVIPGLVVGYIFYLRNSFGVQITVLERSKVRPAMRRSKTLTDGAKWRVVLMWLITAALFFVAGMVQAPMTFLSMFLIMKGGHAFVTEAIGLVVNFVSYTVVTPIPMIGMSLLYFDQRVRKEAFDIEFLLGEERALEAGTLSPSFSSAHLEPPQAVDATSL